MNPIFLVTIAMITFAIQNNLLHQKLTHLSVFTIIVFFYSIMLPLAVIFQVVSLRITGETFVMPNWKELGFLALTATLLLMADTLYTSAYTNGGSVVAVTTIAATLPIISSIIGYLIFKETISVQQGLGCILAVLGVFLVARG
jgi:drug/metabolite transporter (DMT)-like permease